MPHLQAITKLFTQQVIRSTAAQRPLDMVPLTIPRARAFFHVRNDHNQELTVEIIASSYNNPASAGLSGSTGTIPANSVRTVVTDIWAPYLALEARYATAPTTGNLTIEGEAE